MCFVLPFATRIFQLVLVLVNFLFPLIFFFVVVVVSLVLFAQFAMKDKMRHQYKYTHIHTEQNSLWNQTTDWKMYQSTTFPFKSCFTILCAALCQIQSHFTSLSIIIMESFRFLSLSISATFWIETSRVHVVRLALFVAVFFFFRHSIRFVFFVRYGILLSAYRSIRFGVFRLDAFLDFVHANLK